MYDISSIVQSALINAEKNAILREKNAILTCMLVVMFVCWRVERHKRIHQTAPKGD